MSHRCPRCHAQTSCGIEQGKTHCWCFDVPKTLSINEEWKRTETEENKTCLCPSCLREVQQAKANSKNYL